ncbi:MAG: hypothetical protein HFI16_10505 [Lachnospiraceae bacterium]|nr:hypothetical protein [Lachnospiraceae bacterium]
MLGKLMKYDMKSMSRAFIPMWILAPVISLLLSFSIRGVVEWANSPMMGWIVNAGNSILMVIMILLFMAVLIGLLVMTIMFVIQRFWNGLLKEEGYLMFTLPVKVWELIVSKALTATLVASVSIVVGIFSGMILAVFSTSDVVYIFAYIWKNFLDSFVELGPVFWINLLLFIIMMILGTAGSIYHVYAAMSLGHLFATHKVVGSCLSYIGISIITSVVENIIGAVMGYVLPDINYYGMSWGLMEAMSSLYLLYMIAAAVLQIVILHIITERILSKKLNLE